MAPPANLVIYDNFAKLEWYDNPWKWIRMAWDEGIYQHQPGWDPPNDSEVGRHNMTLLWCGLLWYITNYCSLHG